MYLGMLFTAAIISWGLKFLRFVVYIRDVCVLTALFFASNMTIVAYIFGKEIWDSGAGLVVAALIPFALVIYQGCIDKWNLNF